MVKTFKKILSKIKSLLDKLEGKRALIETTIIAMFISIIIIQIMLPALIPMISSFLDDLKGIDAVNFLVWIALLAQLLVMSIVNALFSMPNKYRALFLFSLSLLSAVFSILIICYSSYLYVQFFSDLLDSVDLFQPVLYFFYYPAWSVALTNDVSGFWLFSSIVFSIIQIIMFVTSVKK